MTDPIAVIRAYFEGDITRAEQALNSGDFMNKNYHAACLRDAKQALAALDQVEGMVLPEIEGWRLIELKSAWAGATIVWEAQIYNGKKAISGEGSTPNAACIAAKAKIEGGGG